MSSSGTLTGTSAVVGRPSKRRNPGSAPPLRGLIPLILALVIWQLTAIGGYAPQFPPPSEWAIALVSLGAGGQLLPAMLSTVVSFVVSLVLASLIGAAIGILVGMSRRTDRVVGPAFEFARTLPAGAIVPVAVLIIGFTQSMTIAVVVFTSLWSVLLSTRAGARLISSQRLETARVMRLSTWDTFRKVILPSLLPSVLLGVQIAAPLALIITLVVEVITQVSGIGKQIGLAQQQFQSAEVFGLVAVTGIIGLLVNLGVSGLTHLTRRFES